MTAAPNLSLYSLAEDYQSVIDEIEANGGEITFELSLKLSEITDYFEVKAEKVALFIRNQLALAAAAKEESRRLSELADQRTRTAENLKRYLLEQMQNTGKLKIDRPLAKLAVVKVGGKLAVTWDGGEAKDIPDAYRIERHKVEYSLDRELALQMHETGQSLPAGITVHPRGTRLSIA